MFIGTVLVSILALLMFGLGSYNATVYTTLEDYELAVGVCVNNDGVDYIVVNSSYDAVETIYCINGAEFHIPDEIK